MELITLKSPREQDAMRRAGRITAEARALAGRMVRPGVSTKEIDDAVRKFIRSQGGQPSFLEEVGARVGRVGVVGAPAFRRRSERDGVVSPELAIHQPLHRTRVLLIEALEDLRIARAGAQQLFEAVTFGP